MVVTAPDELRDQLRELPIDRLVELARGWRPGGNPASLTAVSKLALRSLARRYLHLTEEISTLDTHLTRLINPTVPQLLEVKGIGPTLALPR